MKVDFVEFIEKELGPDTLFITCGLPASYKTETSEVVEEKIKYRRLRTDLIRLEVLKGEDIFDEKVASNMDKRTQVYDKMFEIADQELQKEKGIILDATFVTQELRVRAAEVATRHDKNFVIQQTQCPKEVSLKRIARRTKKKYESNALTDKAYTNNLKKFEEVDLKSLKEKYPKLKGIHYKVDTTFDETKKWVVVEKNEI